MSTSVSRDGHATQNFVSGLFSPALAELVGTYMLAVLGGGSVLASIAHSGRVDPSTAGLGFGAAVAAIVYCLGHISGAHINPAVTVGLAAARRFPWRAVPIYVVAQMLGGLLGALTLWAMFGDRARERAALSAASPGTGVGELTVLLTMFIVTVLLLIVVMALFTDTRASHALAGVALGAFIGVGIIATLPITGGAFSVARNLGAMIVAGEYTAWWAYVLGPLLGGPVGAVFYERLLRQGHLVARLGGDPTNNQ